MQRYEKYKPSGIEWIGEVPEHWNVLPFKRVTKRIEVGIAEAATHAYASEGVPILRATNIKNGRITGEIRFIEEAFAKRNESKALFYNDIVTVRTGNAGLSAVVPKELDKCQCFTMLISTLKDSNPYYYNYLLNSSNGETYFEIAEWGTAQKNISVPILQSFPAPIPPRVEQDSIVKFLDRKTEEINDLIHKKENLIEALREERMAVISDAVSGEGKSWPKKKLKHLLLEKLKYGANEPADSDDWKNPRYIRITDFGEDGRLREDTFKSLPNEIAKDYLLKEGDILFARSGATVGKTFQFKNYNGRACFAGYLIKATPDQDQILTDFLYYFTKSNIYENWKGSIFNQATIQNIGADKYSMMEIAVPSIDEQKSIISGIEAELIRIDEVISKIETEIQLIQEYRMALISEVVTGKIKVV